jgi:rubrerythrin
MPTPALKALAQQAGVSLDHAEKVWNKVKDSINPTNDREWAMVMGGVKTALGVKQERDYPMDVHFQEEITTTANLGVGNIAQTRPDQDQPFVCSSCGYGADKDLGGACPKCGGRMAARESWIREIIRRVESGESPHSVLSSLLR